MAVTTIPAPIPRHHHHLLVYVGIAIAALALVASVLVGMAVTGSDSGTDFPATGSGVHQELPTRFGENRPAAPNAIAHRAAVDPARAAARVAAERNR
jgi:hypothetical protein